MKILELLRQRRVWVGILGVVAFTLPIMGVVPTADVNGSSDLFVNLFNAVDGLIVASLALWSYFLPKK